MFEIPRTPWYSLQKGASAEVAAYPRLVDLGEIDTDASVMETAGVLSHLDLLIACDSGPAHIAGALGACPVWVLLNFLFDPRWCACTEESRRYPHTHRLFQQDEPGQWDPVIEQVTYELADAIAAGAVRRS